MSKILVTTSGGYEKAIKGLGDITTSTNDFLKSPESFKLVLFTGGADVSPELYNDTSPNGLCMNSKIRDVWEMEVFNTALKNNILMTGICRGLQFLNVMAGGTLIHHLSNHEGSVHSLVTTTTDKMIVNSLHHQMILPPSKDCFIIGECGRRMSNDYYGEHDNLISYNGRENEVAIFTKIKAFGVQYHPEFMREASAGFKYYYEMVKTALSISWEKFVTYYTKENINNVLLSRNYKHHTVHTR